MDGKSKRQVHSRTHENGVKYNSSMKNVVYGDENMYETNKLEYPGNTLLRNKGLPEKLEKHLNNEKERELESLYEENRQLLMEISKLRKTNQLLVKDVNKKNEIIDSLDSSLVEVEEKLENVKKKNWNMYNGILSREKDQKENHNRERSVDVDQSEGEFYNLRASKIGTFNTVDIVKSSNKKESTEKRPKSTSTSTSTENIKWLQDMILESLSEKGVEKRAYDDLKYEVEKLQKEIYSMQTDLLKSSQQEEIIQEPVIDQTNGKLSVFHSTNSSTNNSSVIGRSVSGFNTVNNAFRSTSLAQELNEVSSTANNGSNESLKEQETAMKEQDQENYQANHHLESIPPRSVHILMGKTFSRGNNIDEKINRYKNGPKYTSENSNFINHPMQSANNYYSSMQTPFLTQINQHYQQQNIPFGSNNGCYYYSFSNTNTNNAQYQQYYGHLYPRNCPQAYYYTNPFSSIPSNDNSIGNNLYQFQDHSHPYNYFTKTPVNHQEYISGLENHLAYTGGENNNNMVNHYPSMTNSLVNPNTNLNCLDRGRLHHQYPKLNVQESVSGQFPVPTNNSSGSVPFPTQNFSPYKQSNMPFPPFKIKVTQKFRRNRNHSVPLQPKDNSCSEHMVVDETTQPLQNLVEESSKVSDQEQLPEGYIRFKTSISSPLSQDDFFSPVSLNINKVCPCDKAISSCATMSKRLIENITEEKNTRARPFSTTTTTTTTTLPLPVSLISKNNQFMGTSGLLKFSKY